MIKNIICYIIVNNKNRKERKYKTMLALQPTNSTQVKTFNNDYFQRFINYADVKPTTLQGYTVCIRAFIKYLQAHNITQPQREDIKAYKQYLDSTNHTAGTKRQYLRAVKQLFKWLSSEGLYPNIADNIKGAKVRQDNTRKDSLTREAVQDILNAIDRSTEAGKRDYAIILLSVTAGLRIIELQRANIEDIKTIAGEQVLFIQGKGHDEKDDYKKLTPEVQEVLKVYLESRENTNKKQPLFTGTGNRAKGQRLTEPSLSRIIKTAFKNAGYDSDRITAHSLRHTSVTMLLKAGATLQEAQQHARHADPATTGIYAHNIDREKQHTEQQVYNYIFNSDDSNLLLEKAKKLINSLNNEQLQKTINFIEGVRI